MAVTNRQLAVSQRGNEVLQLRVEQMPDGDWLGYVFVIPNSPLRTTSRFRELTESQAKSGAVQTARESFNGYFRLNRLKWELHESSEEVWDEELRKADVDWQR